MECKLCVPETRSEVLSLVVAGCSKHCSWGLLPSVMFLPTNKSWFGSFGSVWSRHKLFLVLFLLLEFHLSERASTLLDQADSKSKLFSYICVTETPPARDMTILYKYIQSIVQAILVPFYPLLLLTLLQSYSVSISAAFHSFVFDHISITCSGKSPTPVCYQQWKISRWYFRREWLNCIQPININYGCQINTNSSDIV